MINTDEIFPKDVLTKVIDASKDFDKQFDRFTLYTSYKKFEECSLNVPNLAPRNNCLVWACDIINLVNEIKYEYIWMTAWATHFIERNNINNNITDDFHVKSNADNCAIRINSYKDKIALLIWSYYCPFDPRNKDEVLSFYQILERIRHPVKFALNFKPDNSFIEALQTLDADCFKTISKYRNSKIHRLEPKVWLTSNYKRRDFGYIISVLSDKDMEGFNKRVNDMYDSPRNRFVKDSCEQDGVFYDNISIDDQNWPYETLKAHFDKCIELILMSASKTFATLSTKEPFCASSQQK